MARSASAPTRPPAAGCRRHSPVSRPPAPTAAQDGLHADAGRSRRSRKRSSSRRPGPRRRSRQLASERRRYSTLRKSSAARIRRSPTLLRSAPGAMVVAQRQPGRGHVALPARRREQLHEGPARRHPAQRAGRHVRLRQRHHREPRARRARAGRAVGAVRIGRDGRRRPAVHDAGARPAPAAARRSRAGTFGTARVSASAAGRAGGFDYSVGVGALHDRQRRARTTSSTTRRCPERPASALSTTATLRFVGRAELGNVGTPGRPLSAGPTSTPLRTPQRRRRRHLHPGDHAGVHAACDLRAVGHRTRRRRNLIVDPPYTPSFGASTAPFEFFDFTYDSHNELRRHYATYQADWRLPARPAARRARTC